MSVERNNNNPFAIPAHVVVAPSSLAAVRCGCCARDTLTPWALIGSRDHGVWVVCDWCYRNHHEQLWRFVRDGADPLEVLDAIELENAGKVVSMSKWKEANGGGN